MISRVLTNLACWPPAVTLLVLGWLPQLLHAQLFDPPSPSHRPGLTQLPPVDGPRPERLPPIELPGLEKLRPVLETHIYFSNNYKKAKVCPW